MYRTHKRQTIFVTAISAIAMNPLFADLESFNSSNSSNNERTRDAWLAAVGIQTPEQFVNFESGFVDGQNVSGEDGHFPGGMIIEDTGPGTPQATIRSGNSVIGGSNPIGRFSVTHDEQQYLELDFSEQPIDYLAFRDIDHTGTGIIVTFVGGATANISIETTATGGDSAEFIGLFRNDTPRITRIQLNASGDNVWGIDNIEYGFDRSLILGDINCDGVVDLLDVSPFVELLSTGGYIFKADVNQDGAVDLLDVSPFVALLTGN